jgi:hypothetical protein
MYTSPNIIRVIISRRTRRTGYVALMGKMRNPCRILVGKPEEKRSLGRSRHVWEANIKLDLREIEWKGVDWMHLAQDRDLWWTLVNTVTNLRVP